MYGIMTKKEAMAASEKRMAEYRMGDACERAFDRYEANLIAAGKQSLMADRDVRWAVSRVFFSAETQEQLDGYMAMEPKDIAALAATA